MSATNVALAIASVWLLGSVALIARSVRAGRTLADALAARHPDTYEELGRPRPTYLESVRRNRFTRFILRQEYKSLDDTVLEPQFEKYRSDELRRLALIGTGAVVTFAVLLWARHAA
jgi:hypothetical protein